MIAVVALLVIGPEKLPKVARTLGLLAGRMQRYVANVKSDIEREMQFEDLHKIQQEIREGVMQAKSNVDQAGAAVSNEVAALERDMTALAEANVAAEQQSAILTQAPPAINTDHPQEVLPPKSSQ